MTAEEKSQQEALELLEKGKEGDGVMLTKKQCAHLLDYIEERFNDGYGCGANNSVTW